MTQFSTFSGTSETLFLSYSISSYTEDSFTFDDDDDDGKYLSKNLQNPWQ